MAEDPQLSGAPRETAEHRAALPIRSVGRRLRVGQVFALACGVLAIVAVGGTVIGEISLHELTTARRLALSQIDPARTTALELNNALIDQESGLRGYVLAGQARLLDPYTNGLVEERQAYRRLEQLTRRGPLGDVRSDLAQVHARAARWHSQYANLLIEIQRRNGQAATVFRSATGRKLFNPVRSSLRSLNDGLGRAGAHARARLAHSAKTLELVFGAFAALLLVVAILLTLVLRTFVSRPIERLSRQVRRVALGEFQFPLQIHGPRDVAELASDVDSMRMRIVHELETASQANERLDSQAQDLARSNAELEQFAYVASHDLQEPLRKVASFTQLLQRRYSEQLDERADEYIAFAVDGAMRMQTLINDLLAFSRVGRIREPQERVDLEQSLASATRSLAAIIEETGAEIDAGPLPSVRGEPGLLALVFQNLIGNALKFHGDEPPIVRIAAERRGDEWLISCADNGIGIEPQYMERIFVIFQRLHTRERYEGTGIGLAMCRKIMEYHGGQIWVERDPGGSGARFRFTLPVMGDQSMPTADEPKRTADEHDRQQAD